MASPRSGHLRSIQVDPETYSQIRGSTHPCRSWGVCPQLFVVLVPQQKFKSFHSIIHFSISLFNLLSNQHSILKNISNMVLLKSISNMVLSDCSIVSSRYLSYLLSPIFANSSTTWRNVTTVWPWSTYVDPGTFSQSRVSTVTRILNVSRSVRKPYLRASYRVYKIVVCWSVAFSFPPHNCL